MCKSSKCGDYLYYECDVALKALSGRLGIAAKKQCNFLSKDGAAIYNFIVSPGLLAMGIGWEKFQDL